MDSSDEAHDESTECNPLQNGSRGTKLKPKIVSAAERKRTRRKNWPVKPVHIELEHAGWRREGGKFVFASPGIMKHKEPREYKLKAFITFLFFLIVITVSLTFVFHKQQLLQLMQVAVGERIRFHEDTRILYISNSAKADILKGKLGTTLSGERLPYDCRSREKEEHDAEEVIPDSVYRQEKVCLEWKKMARLNIVYHRHSDNERCYTVSWESLNWDWYPQDCYDMNEADWYGVGEVLNQEWPINTWKKDLAPYVTGNFSTDPYGSVVEPYWLSSKGVAIVVDSRVPLYVSMNSGGDRKLCFIAKYERRPPIEIEKKPLPLFLNYTICTGVDVKSVHTFVSAKLRPKPSRLPALGEMLDKIVWMTHNKLGRRVNQEDVQNYVQNIKYPVSDPGLLVLDDWQGTDGDFDFDPVRFPTPKDILNTITTLKHFKLALTVSPYISTTSLTFYKEENMKLWIADVTGEVPSLTRWDDLISAAVIDLTNPLAPEWFRNKLIALKKKYDVGFFFKGGETTFLPYYYSLTESLTNPDTFVELYAKMAVQTEPAYGISAATNCQELPVFVSMAPRTSSWGANGLQSVLPTILSVGLIGYPFIMPGPVGGDGDFMCQNHSAVPTNPYNFTLGTNKTWEETELYIRWLQLATFLPVLQFSIPPEDFGVRVVELAHKFYDIRLNLVVPLLRTLANEAISDGYPLIRPLWWIAPNDSIAQKEVTQFLVGDSLLVAPVLDRNVTRRDIYLPPGMWLDNLAKVEHKGGKWLHDYPVSIENIAYFIRKRDEFGAHYDDSD